MKCLAQTRTAPQSWSQVSDPELLGPFSSLPAPCRPFEPPFTLMLSCEKRPPEQIVYLSAAQAPQVLSRRRRPNLGRMTVSPDVHFPRASGDRSRQKPRLPAAPGGAGEDPTARASRSSERTDFRRYLTDSLGCFHTCAFTGMGSVPQNETPNRF